MSQFATIKTTIKDRVVLVRCLQEMGYPVEEGNDLPLYGYGGDRRSQTADIIIRRKHLGTVSNDIGFKKVGNYYEMIISSFDQNTSHGKSLQSDLQQKVLEMEKQMREIENAIKRKYADEKIRQVAEQMKNQGFKLRKREEKGKQIVYEFVRLT